jgi:hypothetical protein
MPEQIIEILTGRPWVKSGDDDWWWSAIADRMTFYGRTSKPDGCPVEPLAVRVNGRD